MIAWQSIAMFSSSLLFCVCCLGFASANVTLYHALENAEEHFERFIQEHGRQYADENEKLTRFQIFIENLNMAIQMNEKSTHAEYGITPFMDMTKEEFVNNYSSLKPSQLTSLQLCKVLSDSDIGDADAPESFDWREHNAVSPVQKQGCNNCYAYSAAANIEGQLAIKYKKLPHLSQQQIVDCDWRNSGCNGGFMSNAFRTIIQIGGIMSEASYPSRNRRGRCMFNPRKVVAKLTNCYSFNITSQEKLKQLLYKTGPISIAITIDKMQTYHGGVMSDEDCGTGSISHAVVLVGYGVEKNQPYWIVKNSWGKNFGEQGYFRVVRGEGHTSCMMMNVYMATSVVA